MNKLKLFVLFLALTVFWGCTRENADSVTTILIDLDRSSQKISVKDIFSKVEVIPLQTSELSLIKSADKTIYYNKKYYVSDMDQHAVFMFDTAGRFLKKIQKNTRGLGAFEMFRDIEINKFDNTLEMLSPNGTVFVYTLDGTYLRTFFVPEVKAVHFFKHIDKDIVVFYGMFEEQRVVFYSKSSNKVLSSTFPVPRFLSTGTPLNSPWSPFYRFKEDVYFSPSFTNTVYNVTKSDLKGKYEWNFGKYAFNYDTLTLDKPAAYYRGLFNKSAKLIWSRINNFETNDKIFTTFLFNGKINYLMYNKSSKAYNVFDTFSEGVIYPLHLEFNDTFFLGAIDPNKIADFVKPEMLDTANAELLKSIKQTDNPILIKYTLSN